MTEITSPDARSRRAAGLLGVVLLAAFFAIDETYISLSFGFVPAFSYSEPAEVYFYLAHAFILVPAALALSYALTPLLEDPLRKLNASVSGLSRKDLLQGLGVTFLFGVISARITRAVFLYDLPVTDDENAVRFGGQLLASGRWSVDEPALYHEMPRLFDYNQDGQVASMDFIGGQIAMMFSELGLGPWVHALLAAVPIVALAALVGRLLGRKWGLVAALLFAFSPMAFTLSMTQHAHVVSRAFIAIAIAALGFGLHRMEGDQGKPGVAAALAGLALGAALATRPLETLTITSPLVAYFIWTAIRRKQLSAILTLAACAAPFLALMLVHNASVTGNPFESPRFTGTQMYNSHIIQSGPIPESFDIAWNRFGSNMSYNAFMLMIWFLGPLGVLAVYFGALRNRFTLLLTAGVVLNVGATLLHDIHGVHHVGPIHRSECAVPLTIIAAFGLHHLVRILADRGVSRAQSFVAIGALCIVGLGVFNLWNGLRLQRANAAQAEIYDAISDDKLPKSVVLTSFLGGIRFKMPQHRPVGGWVLRWRHNRPDSDDHVLLINDSKRASAAAAAAYPDRVLLRLLVSPEGELEVVPALPGSGPDKPYDPDGKLPF